MTLIISSMANGSVSDGSQYGTVTSPYTLPDNPVFGAVVKIHGDGVQWVVTAPSTYYITNGQTGTTLTGITGYESAALQYIGNSIWNVVYANAQNVLPESCVLYLPFTGVNNSTAIMDYSYYRTLMTVAGDAKISTTQSKFGGSSLYLDGTGDYIYADGSASKYAFGTGDFSISMWIYLSVKNALYGVIDWRTSGTTNLLPLIYINSDNTLHYSQSSGERIVGTTALTTGIWYYLSLIRSSGSTKLYLNGVQEGSTYADANNYTIVAIRPAMGLDAASGNGFFNGYIDEIAIWKGLAISPVVPTRPLIGQLVLS